VRHKYFVFVSHSSADAWTAGRLHRAIRELGADAFLSTADIAGGDDFGAKMQEAMERADECVVLYTPEAAQSRTVWIELGGAWFMRKRVVIIVSRMTVSEVTSDPRFPQPLNALDCIDLNSEVDSRYLPEFEARIHAHRSNLKL
jgi:hypothetical protein